MAKKGETKITRPVQLKYLELLRTTGLKELSAYELGMNPSTMGTFRSRHPEFDDEVLEAMKVYSDSLAKEVHRRGVSGVDTPVFGKLGKIGTKKVYSDRLLEMQIKRHDPAYREKQTIDHNVNGGVLVVPELAKSSKDWEDEENGGSTPDAKG